MSDVQPTPSWWQASDGRWYPPEQHPLYQPAVAGLPPYLPPPPELPELPEGPPTIGTPGAGPSAMADNNQKGADGERQTGDALGSLPPTYRVVHGLKMGSTKADIDHLVIGPTGVWVIDSKAWSGHLTAGKGMLWRGRTPIRREIDGVERQAAYARDVLGSEASSVLCFVGTGLPRPAQMVERTRVLSLEALAPYLESNPVVLTSDRIATLFERAKQWSVRPPGIEPGPRRRSSEPAPFVRKGNTHKAPIDPEVTPLRSERKAKDRSSSGQVGRNVGAFLTKVVVTLCFVAALLGFIKFVASSMLENGMPGSAQPGTEKPISTPAAPGEPTQVPSSIPDPGYFTAKVVCPEGGGGYTVQGRVPMFAGVRVRVTLSNSGFQKYLGEFSAAQPVPEVPGIAPNGAVGFDIQSVDPAGQAGQSYRVDIVTPAAPC